MNYRAVLLLSAFFIQSSHTAPANPVSVNERESPHNLDGSKEGTAVTLTPEDAKIIAEIQQLRETAEKFQSQSLKFIESVTDRASTSLNFDEYAEQLSNTVKAQTETFIKSLDDSRNVVVDHMTKLTTDGLRKGKDIFNDKMDYVQGTLSDLQKKGNKLYQDGIEYFLPWQSKNTLQERSLENRRSLWTRAVGANELTQILSSQNVQLNEEGNQNLQRRDNNHGNTGTAGNTANTGVVTIPGDVSNKSIASVVAEQLSGVRDSSADAVKSMTVFTTGGVIGFLDALSAVLSSTANVGYHARMAVSGIHQSGTHAMNAAIGTAGSIVSGTLDKTGEVVEAMHLGPRHIPSMYHHENTFNHSPNHRSINVDHHLDSVSNNVPKSAFSTDISAHNASDNVVVNGNNNSNHQEDQSSGSQAENQDAGNDKHTSAPINPGDLAEDNGRETSNVSGNNDDGTNNAGETSNVSSNTDTGTNNGGETPKVSGVDTENNNRDETSNVSSNTDGGTNNGGETPNVSGIDTENNNRDETSNVSSNTDGGTNNGGETPNVNGVDTENNNRDETSNVSSNTDVGTNNGGDTLNVSSKSDTDTEGKGETSTIGNDNINASINNEEETSTASNNADTNTNNEGGAQQASNNTDADKNDTSKTNGSNKNEPEKGANELGMDGTNKTENKPEGGNNMPDNGRNENKAEETTRKEEDITPEGNGNKTEVTEEKESIGGNDNGSTNSNENSKNDDSSRVNDNPNPKPTESGDNVKQNDTDSQGTKAQSNPEEVTESNVSENKD